MYQLETQPGRHLHVEAEDSDEKCTRLAARNC